MAVNENASAKNISKKDQWIERKNLLINYL